MAVNNSLTTKGKSVTSLGSHIASFMTSPAIRDNITSIVGGKNADRFMSSIVSAVNANPGLKECTNTSIVSAALLGQSLNLSPSPQLGQYYFVPFNNKKTGVKDAQFILGYRGLIQLAIRSGQYKKLNVLPIKEGELIKFDPLNEDIEVNLIEDEDEREKAPTIGYYAFFEYLNGFRKAIYWSKEKMLHHADRYSQAFSLNATSGRYPKVSYADFVAGKYPKKDEWLYSSFWYSDFDGMACKTMLRQLISKWGIMSIDLVTATASDGRVIEDVKGDGSVDYADEDLHEESNQDTPDGNENDAQDARDEDTVTSSPDAENATEAALFGQQ